MAIRFTVHADDREECAAGLRMLESLALKATLLPAEVVDDRWIARAVPVERPAGGASARTA
jgi:hypothetical protein